MPESVPKAACWLNPEQAGLIGRALAAAGIRPVAAGCPEPTHTGQVARDLGCEPCGDLRSALTTMPIDLVFIAAPGDFAHRAADQDLTALQIARSRAVAVATMEPVPAAAMELGGTRWSETVHNGALADLVRITPRTHRSAAAVELHATLETFGVPRTCSVRMMGPAVLGTLGARLFDAMDLVRTLMGVPEAIDACFVAPTQGRALHQLPGESLRGLSGDMTAHLRFADGRAAALHLSDQAPRSLFDLRITGAEGVITLDPGRLVWTHPGGEHDATTLETPPGDPGEAELIAQLNSVCAGVGAPLAPVDYPAVLSMAHAALLSCRTGQAEAPDTIRRLIQTA